MVKKINYTPTEVKANIKMTKYYAISGIILLILELIFYSSDLSMETFFSWRNTPFMFIVLAGVMYLITLFQMKNGYATLSEEKLTRNTLVKKSINLGDIDSIRKFAGDYIFKKNNKEVFRLNIQRCKPEDVIILNDKMDALGISWL